MTLIVAHPQTDGVEKFRRISSDRPFELKIAAATYRERVRKDEYGRQYIRVPEYKFQLLARKQDAYYSTSDDRIVNGLLAAGNSVVYTTAKGDKETERRSKEGETSGGGGRTKIEVRV